jgi:hypothetical protein
MAVSGLVAKPAPPTDPSGLEVRHISRIVTKSTVRSYWMSTIPIINRSVPWEERKPEDRRFVNRLNDSTQIVSQNRYIKIDGTRYLVLDSVEVENLSRIYVDVNSAYFPLVINAVKKEENWLIQCPETQFLGDRPIVGVGHQFSLTPGVTKVQVLISEQHASGIDFENYDIGIWSF